MAYFLGIDGGGSKTECVLGDEARVLGRAVGPSAKIQVVGRRAARAALLAAVRRACADAGIRPRQIARACIGLAGVSRADIAPAIRNILGEVLRCPVEVVGDNAIALEAALGEGPGVIVIAGTGSIAYGRNRRGEQARAGGWGPAISDEGSGGWIGRSAVAQVMRAADGGASSPRLERAILRAWKIRTRQDMVRVANQNPPPGVDFAALFPLVLKAAQRDPVAPLVLKRAALELTRLAAIVMQRLWPQVGAERVRVRMAGGVFRHSALVRREFAQWLRMARPDAAVSSAVVDPVLGALAMARKAHHGHG